MSITSTNYSDISYVAEVTAGTTPATPAFQLLPTTGGSPMSNLTTAVSEVIRSDRMIDDLIVVDSEVSGDINYELSYAPYKPLIDACLRNDTPTTVAIAAASDIVMSNTNSEITSTTTDFSAAGIVAGMFFRVSGAALDAANNGIYKVTSVTDANTLVVDPAPNSDQVAEASVDIDAIHNKNSNDAASTFTFCKRIQGIAAPAYYYYRGCAISNMSFNFNTGEILTGGLSLFGRTEEATETGISGQSYVAVPSYDLMNAVQSVVSINVSGLPAATEFSSLTLNLNNNTTGAKAIGTLGSVDVTDFTFEATGDISLYFEDLNAYNAYQNSTSFALDLTLQDATGNNIIISMPKCKFETLEAPIDGKDSFLMLSGTFRALRDETQNSMVEVTFIPA